MLTYGSEIWLLTRTQKLELARFEQKILRRIYGVLTDLGGEEKTPSNLFKDLDVVE